MNLTQEYIAGKLQDARKNADESDGYAEIPVKPDTRLKCAAVLIPLALSGGEWHLLFTRRTNRVQ
jgi:hypothetical protein